MSPAVAEETRWPHPFYSFSVLDFIMASLFEYSVRLGAEHSQTRQVHRLAERVADWFFETARREGAFNAIRKAFFARCIAIQSRVANAHSGDIDCSAHHGHAQPRPSAPSTTGAHGKFISR